MEKESAREMVEVLEKRVKALGEAESYVVIAEGKDKVNFFANGNKDNICSLLLSAVTKFVNEVSERNIIPGNKRTICNLLLKTLRATDNAQDLVSLTYDEETETVTALFASGGARVINVHMDSGTAMIRDIMNHLGC